VQVAFLYNGRYCTLSQRITGSMMAHVDPNEGRTVSFEYLNQQLVWGELQHFVMFLLPLLTPGSLSANTFLASIAHKVVQLHTRAGASHGLHIQPLPGRTHCQPRVGAGMGSKQQPKEADTCCICSTQRVVVAVESLCCGATCCYMCAQRLWQLSPEPRCSSCAKPFKAACLQPILAEPDD
jgi:hypothetical protein